MNAMTVNRIFTNIAVLAGAALALAGCGGAATVTGKVSCDGKGLKGVVVSDGVEVVKTDSRGRYRMNSKKENGYVFVSVPSGYEVGADRLIPKFFVRLNGDGKETADFELTKVDQSDVTLFVTTDIHLTGDPVDKDLPEFHKSFLPDIIKTIGETPGKVYSLCLGDMTTDGKWYKNGFSFPEYLREMDGYPTPIFHIMGNHDNDQRGEGTFSEWESLAEERFRKEIGPNYYSLNIGNFHILMLDDIITTGPKKEGNPADTYVGKFGFTYAIDSTQMEWIRKDLAAVPEDRNLIVAMHVPYYTISGFEDGRMKYEYTASSSVAPDGLMAMISKYRHVDMIAGHHHRTQVIPLAGNIISHDIASASAVSWKINDIGAPMVCDDGTPAGYQIFRLQGDSLSWRFKSNYKPVAQSQCNVYDLNTIPSEYGGEPGSNAVLVNVFNWDPEWTVSVRENGVELPVEQVYGYDPMYVRIRRETKSLAKRPTAFLETKTPHLFRCVRSSADSQVEVTVMDRFGNVYKAALGDEAVIW